MAKGIKETTEMVDFVLSLVQAVMNSAADGKIDFLDMANFVSPMMSAAGAITGSQEIAQEIMDLDAAEKTEIETLIKNKFTIDNKKLELAIEGALAAALGIIKAASAFKKL